ncbi:signal peptidase I [Enterococcus moraviensis ATCC BAA-383]|uniref:Signal peptidase I n=1 Tax=Enterococcus moraviensis ATCC BAA-383 TaxID=1158609 RepID=R2SUI8_9ENTE|nr:signal peptidase I [Enterococcus moraviensis]EOH98905.1 signal peptidase I [Enterococcus moraviensis ATCC BAA-383]EOT71920.1 signal peptidase I [Enterococcus moraviensis ATCC BAA-383]
MKQTKKTRKKKQPLKKSTDSKRTNQSKKKSKNLAVQTKNRSKQSNNRTKKPSLGKKKHKKVHINRKKEKQRQLIKEIIVSLILLVGLLTIVQSLFFTFPTVEGYGMTPLLNDGERVIVRKTKRIERFDLVYIRDPKTKRTMIRRVIGLPEEEIAYQEDQLFVDQKPIIERFLKKELNEAKVEKRLLTDDFSLRTVTDESRLPKDSYFVLGDNRHYAADSRNFGWVEKKDILGVVKVRIAPLHQLKQF